ncbi:unnamed protein product [Albugo candida]|uniref:Uncharacterized protein n=1 Tax=Albugo candida TaxID=65357 RepID=A0A024GP82_9STRA|nr:unnamed protein product [Albugo candida]|eukprot:CCI48158.1 unnamed protein product [Albugo candida]
MGIVRRKCHNPPGRKTRWRRVQRTCLCRRQSCSSTRNNAFAALYSLRRHVGCIRRNTGFIGWLHCASAGGSIKLRGFLTPFPSVKLVFGDTVVCVCSEGVAISSVDLSCWGRFRLRCFKCEWKEEALQKGENVK